MIPRPAVFSPNLYHLVSSILKRASAKILRQMSSHLEPRARVLLRETFFQNWEINLAYPRARDFSLLFSCAYLGGKKAGKTRRKLFCSNFKKAKWALDGNHYTHATFLAICQF